MGKEGGVKEKLLIATPLYPPEIGGPATYTVLLEKELPQMNIMVTVVAFAHSRSFPKGISHLHYFFQICRKIRSADYVLAQDPVSVGLPTVLAAKLFKKKLIIRMPGDYAWEQSVQRFGVQDTIDDFQTKSYGFTVELLRKLQRWTTRQAHHIIAPSHYFKNVVATWGVNPKNISVVYNGLDIPKVEHRNESYKRTIVTAGRLVPWKGIDALLSLVKEKADWKLIILGDGPEREALEKKAFDTGVAARVQFMGAVSREAVLEHCQRASLFVLNTHFESFSFQIVEAMMVGSRIVTTNIGSLPELITSGKEGVLIAPNDMNALGTIVENYEADAAQWHERSINAKEKAKQFSVAQTVADTFSVFEKI